MWQSSKLRRLALPVSAIAKHGRPWWAPTRPMADAAASRPEAAAASDRELFRKRFKKVRHGHGQSARGYAMRKGLAVLSDSHSAAQ